MFGVPPHATAAQWQRFLARVAVTPGCWFWCGALGSDGAAAAVRAGRLVRPRVGLRSGARPAAALCRGQPGLRRAVLRALGRASAGARGGRPGAPGPAAPAGRWRPGPGRSATWQRGGYGPSATCRGARTPTATPRSCRCSDRRGWRLDASRSGRGGPFSMACRRAGGCRRSRRRGGGRAGGPGGPAALPSGHAGTPAGPARRRAVEDQLPVKHPEDVPRGRSPGLLELTKRARHSHDRRGWGVHGRCRVAQRAQQVEQKASVEPVLIRDDVQRRVGMQEVAGCR